GRVFRYTTKATSERITSHDRSDRHRVIRNARSNPFSSSSWLQRLEVRGKARLGFQKDTHDSRAKVRRQAGVFPCFVFSGKNRPQLRVNRVSCSSGQPVECGGIDHVAAGITHQTLFEIQLPETAAELVPRTAGCKLRLES